ncbi:MAG: FKBP-type peptidyl-prolyl cis-trans isomerase [Nitrospira sp.]|nr:FKBP-type peptidyl-prolyl cis-trans isomerase [Nitrospira sp.]
MKQVKLGNTVRIHYVGMLEGGKVIGKTERNDPLEIPTGKGLFFPRLEQEIIGMETGEEKQVTLQPEEAFGPYRGELIADVPLEEFTERGIEPFEGLTLDVPQENGKTVKAKVTGITDQSVQLDANHPWAGHTVTFMIQVVEVV